MNFEGLQVGILLPAFVAGLLVLATHVPLGVEVLKRGIIFLDLAIAQIAGLGVILAHTAGVESALGVQAAAVGAALLGAAFLRWREARDPAQLEAVIGVVFVATASAAVVLLAKDTQGGEHLKELLVGQILWTTWTSLLPLALITAAVLAAWWGLRRRSDSLGFYLLFAVSVTAAVQVVGVYLVFASLIVPALARVGRREREPDAEAGEAQGGLSVAYGIGASGYALGLAASAFFDVPAGAAIVLALCACSLAWNAMPRRSAV